MRATRIVPAMLAVLVFAAVAYAQDRKTLPPDEESLYVVSAKVGVVNVVEGEVSYKREQAEWVRTVAGDELRDGDIVRTHAASRVEILLTPGCYLRLTENSEFVLTNPHVYQFRIDLNRGSAIIEASSIDGPMKIGAPQGEFSIIKEGLYRFNIRADGRAEVLVRKGRAAVGSLIVKERKKATVGSGEPAAVASLSKTESDSFDSWSRDRARELIALNQRLVQRGAFANPTFAFVSNAWIFDMGCGCYTFLPFRSGFSSPYGWDYLICNPFSRGWGFFFGGLYPWDPWDYGYGYGYGSGYYGGYPGWGSGSGNGRPSSGGGNGGGGGTGNIRPKRPVGGPPTFGPPRLGQQPIRPDSGPRYNPPVRGGNEGPRYNPPVRGGGEGPRYNPPVRSGNEGPRYNPPANGGGHYNSPSSGGGRYNPPSSGGHSSPSSGGGAPHYSPPPSAPASPPASSAPASGGGGHRKN